MRELHRLLWLRVVPLLQFRWRCVQAAGVICLALLSALSHSAAAMTVTSLTLAPGSIVIPPATIVATFDVACDPSTVNASSVILVRAGPDGIVGTGDDVLVVPAGISVAGNTNLIIDLTNVPLPNDLYSIHLSGTGLGITDASANLLDGEYATSFPSGNGTDGGDFDAQFTIHSPPLQVTSLSFSPGGSINSVPTSIVATLSGNIDSASLTANSVVLIRAGLDGVLGTADDVRMVPASITLSSPNQISLDMTGVPMPDDIYNLTLDGTPSQLGHALRFDGANTYVNVVGYGLSAPTSEITVEFWQKPNSQSQQSTFGLSPGQNPNRIQGHVPWIDGMIYWQFGDGPGWLSYPAPTGVIGNWNHFAMVASHTGSFTRIYRNGVLEAEGTSENDFTQGVYDFIIGNNGYSNAFDGDITEFRIWNVARTQAEIVSLMKQRLVGNEAGLAGYWDLSDGSGYVARDKSSGGHNGNLGSSTSPNSNAPAWVPCTAPLNNGITDINGNFLDGEFSGTLPSGNGQPSGTFSASFTLATGLKPSVTVLSPALSSVVTSVPASVNVTFSENIDPATVNANTVFLKRAGPDGLLGTSDDVVVVPAGISTATGVTLDLANVKLPNDIYQLRLLGSLSGPAIADLNGNVLDGESGTGLPSGNGTAGGDFIATFTISVPSLSVTAMEPSPGALLSAAPTSLMVTLNGTIDPATVNAGSMQLLRAGPDGVFGTSDDVRVLPVSVAVSGSNTITLDLTGLNLPGDLYQVTLNGSNAQGNALSFDGSNNFVNVSGFGVTAPASEITVEFWQKVSAIRQQSTFGMIPAVQGNRIQAHVPWVDGNIYWQFGDEPGWLSYPVPGPVIGAWNHFAMVASHSGSYTKIYRNGILEASGGIENDFVQGVYDLMIGGDGYGNRFLGEITEFRIWNQARTQTQIQALMNRRLTGNEAGLAGYWDLNEGAGFVAHDKTSNALDGTLGTSATANPNAPAWVSSAAPIETTIADINGNNVDGEFSGTLPSGNGAPGGNFTATFRINPPPVAVAQQVSTHRGTALPVTLSGSSVLNGSLTFTVTSTPAHGTLSGATPNLTYHPATGYLGSDSFSFKANDGFFDSTVATVSISVTDSAPAATPQSIGIHANTVAQITLAGTDAENDVLSYINTQPSHGSLTGTAPSLTYTPNTAFVGSDSFTFTTNDGSLTSTSATVTINVGDSAPVASPQLVSTHFNAPASITLFVTDSESDVLSYIVTAPAHGTLSGTAPALTYTPAAAYFGADSFTFTANDSALDSNIATVTISVADTASVASPQTATTHFNVPVPVALVATDSENDALSYIVSAPAHGTLSGTAPALTYTPASAYVGADSFTFKTNDGAQDGNIATVTINVTDTAPVANPQALTTHFNVPVQVSLVATDAENDALSYIVTAPAHGTLSGTAPSLTYTPSPAYVGADSFTFKVNDGALLSNPAVVTLSVTNTSPTVTAFGSPTVLIEDQSVSFASTGSDVNGDALTYAWNFADGSTSALQNPAHTFTTAGTYNVLVTAADGAGAAVSATVTIQVYKDSDRPTARFTTSDVVAFVGAPFTLDGSFSTDPQNAITSYSWNFGDGTASGSGQVISKIYAQTGPVNVTLTVTNSLGLTDTMSGIVEVLPADEIGLFNTAINYSFKFDRAHANADSLSITAVINVGSAHVGADTAVAVTIAGQRYTGTLNSKFRDMTNSNAKWQVQANIRGKPFGEAIVKLQMKHASLGAGFAALGAVAKADLHEVVSVDVPVHIELAGRTFDILVPTDFKFSNLGLKCTGSGSGP